MTTRHRPMLTVTRAIAVLRALGDSPEDLGNNEIARRTGINPSTVSRLLSTLAEDGVVARSSDRGRFRLGPRLVELGNAALARFDLRELAHPHLVALTAATGETSTLSVPADDETVTLDFVQSPRAVRSVAELGRPSVAHATATGKVLLAHRTVLPDEPLRAFTSRTITDLRVLAREVERIRADGWGRAVGEREEDLNAIAAPVTGDRGALVAVLGLQGPASRFGPAEMDAAIPSLTAHAAQLSSPHLP